jgi:hypothetical protein
MSQQQRKQYKSDDELLKMEERSAKYFKAVFEKMFYSLEIEKIKGDYIAFLEKNHPEVLKQGIPQPEPQIDQPVTSEEHGDIKG